jgi:hypothetical protein
MDPQEGPERGGTIYLVWVTVNIEDGDPIRLAGQTYQGIGILHPPLTDLSGIAACRMLPSLNVRGLIGLAREDLDTSTRIVLGEGCMIGKELIGAASTVLYRLFHGVST